ncbi:hypothetical protein [Parasphingorhabdus sp.]|uniref:hypothetical protein n=1 Tax=Parasphingorhabdus sp. TaxID=2709688 RepID=UPI003297E103
MITNEKLMHYIGGHFHEIGGACQKQIFNSVDIVNGFQKDNSISGSIAEIGVRDGKFLIGLSFMLSSDEKLAAIDLFEKQDLNIYRSGWRPPEHGLPFFRTYKTLRY